MTDTAGAHPPGGSPAEPNLPGTTAAGETPSPDLADSDTVVGFHLSVRCPSSRGGVCADIGATLFPALGVDNGLFGEVVGASPPGGDPDAGIWSLRRSLFGQGALLKYQRLWDNAGPRVTMETDYEILGEGADLAAAVCERSLLMVRAHLAAMRESGPELQMSMVVWFQGDMGGEALCGLIRDPGRDVPALVLTGVLSHPIGFFEWRDDLDDQAIVAMLDAAAARRLTAALGKEWSCFSGSARLYRPGWSERDRHDWHPIWRRRKLLPEGCPAAFADRAFRDGVFREVFVTPGRRERQAIADLDARFGELMERHRDLDGRVKQARETLKEAELEVEAIKEDSERQKTDGRDTGSRPGESPERRTAREAVEWAADALRDDLAIGEKAREDADGLGPDAGPPEMVLRHLVRLAEFAREMRRGALADSTPDDAVVRWFQDRGCQVGRDSGRSPEEFPPGFPAEGETHRSDWHVGPGGEAETDGVRIHFKWDPGSGKALVGRIGSDPGAPPRGEPGKAGPHAIPFVRDDGGQADAGIASALPAGRLGVVRAVAIVAGQPFAEVHAFGSGWLFLHPGAFAELVASEFGLEATAALVGEDVSDLRELMEGSDVRRLMLRIGAPVHRHCAVVDGELRDICPLPAGDGGCVIDSTWVRAEDIENPVHAP